MELKPENGFSRSAAESFVVTFEEDVTTQIEAGVDGNTKRLVGLRV